MRRLGGTGCSVREEPLQNTLLQRQAAGQPYAKIPAGRQAALASPLWAPASSGSRENIRQAHPSDHSEDSLSI